ncbi:MAG TPA: hypothetical protein VGX52_16260 [Burkholderiales bacterium]|nr:hypothetical protein [Burkholderiales bacterium]
MRLQTGQEALVARVLTKEGNTGFGFSFRLDAAEARHMAEWHAGLRAERPRLKTVLGHPWEKAILEEKPIPWDYEPGFGLLAWLSA